MLFSCLRFDHGEAFVCHVFFRSERPDRQFQPLGSDDPPNRKLSVVRRRFKCQYASDFHRLDRVENKRNSSASLLQAQQIGTHEISFDLMIMVNGATVRLNTSKTSRPGLLRFASSISGV